ncbi:MAG TPA: hypothetical protein VNZ43_01215 [Sphingomonadaceae bacterium]|nr:hypothetical protein [Sphingomonadaceae bacterium]
MDDVIFARALHVLAVVVWIGGVSMVTTVFFPALRKGALGDNWLRIFHAVEHRFVWQARATTLLVGLTGFYMTWRLDLWSRFRTSGFWWMHAMVCLWLIFMLLLFVGEPLVLHRRLPGWVKASPERAFARLHYAHILLLTLAVITILGAVAGAQGWSPF